ncbi:MAG: T9SS type A sorting domain-containing protein, partial [Pedobacter sp.]
DQNGKVNNLGVKHLNYHFSTPEITVYPNPTTSAANISFEKNVFQSFTLSDLNGRTVQSSKILEDETSIVLKLDNYAKGVYVLKLLGRAAVTTKKIIRK